MIKKTAVVLAAVTTLFMAGCSSYPTTAGDVAEAVCTEFKAGNLKGAELYMSDEARTSSQQNESVIAQFFSLPEFKEQAAGLDCSKPERVQELGGAHKTVYFKGFSVEVKRIDGDWKLIG